MNGAYFVDGSAMVDQLTDYGAGGLDVETGWGLSRDGAVRGSRFRLTRVDDSCAPARGDVLAAFDAKYGHREMNGPGRARIALRLEPVGG